MYGKWLGVMFACITSVVSAQSLRTAGTLLVDVSADALVANDGDAIAQWTNSGSLGGAFCAVTNNAGVCFTNNLLGKKAVVFTASERNALTNSVATPSSVTGTSVWSMEAWVWVASLPAAKSVYLSWTQDAGASTWESSGVLFRYDSGAVALDNLSAVINYSPTVPVAGVWHHLALVRNAFKQEKLFVDGNAVTFSWCPDAAQAGIPIALGAVKKYGTSMYTNFFSGALSRVRIHTGMLSDQDVLHNFMADALNYNAATSTVWVSGSDNWNVADHWSNNVVGVSAKSVRILSGTVAVTNNVSPGVLNGLDVVGATLSLDDPAARIETKVPCVVGRDAGNVGALTVSRGAVAVNNAQGPAVLTLAMDGASASLAIGGSSTAASVLAAHVRAYSAATEIYVNSNGVLEVDAVVADAVTNAPSMTVSGGTIRSRGAPAGLGQFHNVPLIKVSTGGLIFDSVATSTQSVSAALIHDGAGAAKDGGMRKISPGTLILSGTNSYTGDTSVESGTLTLATRLTDSLVYQLDASTNGFSTLQLVDGSNVVAWSDANGSGIVFVTNKSERCPVYDATLFGGRGGLRFLSGDSAETTIIRLATSRLYRMQSVFMVFSPAANNNLGGIWGKSEDDYGIRLQSAAVQLCGNGNDFASSGWNYTNGAPGTAFTVGQPLVVSAIAGSAQMWPSAIGNYWASTQFRRGFRGSLGEILVFDRRLDETERQTVERYLMAKWLGTGVMPQFDTSVLPTNSVLSVLNGATVNLGGISVQLASLNGAGNVVNGNPRSSTLTVGGLNADSLFVGSITGNVALSKVGSGRITLSGPNRFTGPVHVEAGTLRIASSIASITGLVYRLDASLTNTFTMLSDGTNVSAWADANGSGFSFAVSDTAQCPFYDPTLFNGRGGVRFGYGFKRCRMVGASVTNAQTVFAVTMLRDLSNDNGGFWGKNGEDSGLRVGGQNWFWPGNNNDFHYGNAGGAIYLNGVISNSIAPLSIPSLITSVCGSRQQFQPALGDYWGSSSWTNRYYRGEVAEILVYDRKLPDVERQIIEASLMAKWFPSVIGPVLPQTIAVTVNEQATLDLVNNAVTLASLAGGGDVTNGALTVTGTVAPSGTLSVPDASVLSGSLVVNVAANGTCDHLAVAGSLDLSDLAFLPSLPATSPAVPAYTIITAPGGITGTFESASVAAPWRVAYSATDVRLVYLSGTMLLVR